MTLALRHDSRDLAATAAAAARELVTVKSWGASTFVNLPMFYPDGSAVTVKLDVVKAGPSIADAGVRVSDNGFAFRQLEQIGVQRSFGRTAAAIAQRDHLTTDSRTIYADVPFDAVARAICDVGSASWLTVDRVYSRLSEAESADLEDHLRERLSAIFPSRFVPDVRKVVGSSNFDWDVTAVVVGPHGRTIFQAVSAHPNSIHKASSAFLDLSGLEEPPQLVAVVASKVEIGPKLALLNQAGGRIIEDSQPDDVFMRAAA